MSDKTKIEWSDATWNPVTGCTKVSEGCRNCYALTFAERFRGTPGHYFENGFDITLRPDKLDQPLKWTRPRRIFVNSMSDLFHEQVPFDFIRSVWARMAAARQHTFQVLTKRPARALEFFKWMLLQDWRVEESLPNVWLGVSVENQKAADDRIPMLLQTPAAVRFLSCEPLLGPVNLRKWYACNCPGDYYGWNGNTDSHNHYCPRSRSYIGKRIDWVIVGGESGHGARPSHPDWFRSIRDQCQAAGVAFHFKQWGEWFPRDQWEHNTELILPDDDTAYQNSSKTHVFQNGSGYYPVHRVGKHKAGRLLDGREWNEFPNTKEMAE